MKRSLFVVLFLALSIAPLTVHPPSALAQATGNACLDSEEAAFLQLINDYRAQNGAAPLALSQTLSVAADVHSQDMAANNFLSHTGSNGSTADQRIAAAGYPEPGTSAENIFAGDPTAAGAIAWWKGSPGHNAGMRNPNAKAIGIARANNPDSTFKWYWTTTFGRQ